MADDPFRDLLDDSRAGEAAGARARERWLRQQAGEEATLAGTLQDLMEREAAVSVRTTSGRAHQGRLVAVGRDFCALRPATGRPTYLPLAGIASVRPAPGAPAGDAGTDRPVPQDVTLAEVLTDLAPDRPRVSLFTAADTEPVRGALRGVGHDVLTVRLDGDTHGRCYVGLAHLTEATVDP